MRPFIRVITMVTTDRKMPLAKKKMAGRTAISPFHFMLKAKKAPSESMHTVIVFSMACGPRCQ